MQGLAEVVYALYHVFDILTSVIHIHLGGNLDG